LAAVYLAGYQPKTSELESEKKHLYVLPTGPKQKLAFQAHRRLGALPENVGNDSKMPGKVWIFEPVFVMNFSHSN
jgi:hypothetical protein